MKLSLEMKRMIKRLQMLTSVAFILIAIAEGVWIMAVLGVCMFFYFLTIYKVELGRDKDHPEFLYPDKMRKNAR